MAKRILDMINSPADLKLLSATELEILANEIREEIVRVTSTNGGHVASSLGVVETVIAVHSLIDSPKDRFLFDVGHQSYSHMLLTGRREEFKTLRQYRGLSGFPKPTECPYDVHPSGHASDSLSVALGLAKARDINGDDTKIVALIGDASLSGGMAFEALNHIGQEQTPIVIILNDNEMSISRNVGAMVMHLGRLRASAKYRENRDNIQGIMESLGQPGRKMVEFGRNAKESLKQFVVPNSMIFENLGIVCTPPVDGHNIPELQSTISSALEAKAPVLVHVVTRKGAGYAPAMQNPAKFHGVGPYDVETGEIKKNPLAKPSYTKVFSQALLREAAADEDVVAITAAMSDGTGLSDFEKTYPKRFFDVGIAEEHGVGLASGLALGGKKPVFAIYSTFMQRAFDQMIIDNALCDLDVVFCIDRAGLVGDDGPTHHGMFDIAYTRMVPHMRVLAPSDEAELVASLHTALAFGGPFAIRYPRGEAEGVEIPENPSIFTDGESREVREGNDVAILAFGRMVSRSIAAAELLSAHGIEARVVDMRWVKPLDEAAICRAAETGYVITVEEGVIRGGVGEGVLEVLASNGAKPSCLTLGLPDAFIEQGKVDILLRDLGLDAKGIASSIESLYNASEKE